MADENETPYQDEILAHARAPHGHGALEPADARRLEVNRLCGDEVEVFVQRGAAGRLALGFTAKGCALCRASASVLMSVGGGRTVGELGPMIAAFMGRFSDLALPSGAPGALPGTEALEPLRAFPARTRCVLLPWQALAGALASLA